MPILLCGGSRRHPLPAGVAAWIVAGRERGHPLPTIAAIYFLIRIRRSASDMDVLLPSLASTSYAVSPRAAKFSGFVRTRAPQRRQLSPSSGDLIIRT
ncbi:Hypothetical protein A7982_04295 [Minicystis rosea]|nr:Hypothetical protein A7982_04295 [Minicystis rosea]